MNDLSRVIVVGTGPVGLIAALALAKADIPVVLVGPQPAPSDKRTTALMTPALGFLDGLGVLDRLEKAAAPLQVMRIVDATRWLIRSPVVTFRAAEIGADHFGLNVPNSELSAALQAAIGESRSIEWRRTLIEKWDIGAEGVGALLADGERIAGLLAVAADGRLSPTREAAGIKTVARSYPQSALVFNFSHSRPHGFISTEFHTETGPFTQVPLPGNRSSLVWVVKPGTAQELSRHDDIALAKAVEDKMQSMLGRVAVEPGRQIYPLGATLPVRFAQNRVALVGEAAHVFPPIGAQGLNLGIRDVRDLADIASKNRSDTGNESALRDYDRRRRPDVIARASAVNLLNLSLLSGMLPAQVARSAALGFVGSFAPLRAMFMREGLQPGSGLATLASDLREQVRR